MIEHQSHIGFVVAAYAVCALVIVAMITIIVADHGSLRGSLARFGDRGLDRE